MVTPSVQIVLLDFGHHDAPGDPKRGCKGVTSIAFPEGWGPNLRKCYVTPASSRVPNKGVQIRSPSVGTRGHHDDS